jgi:hypothetical protein
MSAFATQTKTYTSSIRMGIAGVTVTFMDLAMTESSPVAGDSFYFRSSSSIGLAGQNITCDNNLLIDLTVDGHAIQGFSSFINFRVSNLSDGSWGPAFQLNDVGLYQVRVHGDYSCRDYSNGSPAAVTNFSGDETRDLFTVVSASTPRNFSIQSLTGPSSLQITQKREVVYPFALTVKDPDHVADTVALIPDWSSPMFADCKCGVAESRAKNGKYWKRTSSGWIVTIRFVQPVVSPAVNYLLKAVEHLNFSAIVSSSRPFPPFNVVPGQVMRAYKLDFRK